MNKKAPENIVFGIWPVIEALREKKAFNKVLIQKANQSEEIPELLQLCKELRVPVQTVPVQKLTRITRKNHQGVIGFTSPIEFLDVNEIVARVYEEGRQPFILVLDRITDVRNFGAICRSAEASGVDAIVIPQKETAMIGPDAIKTSAGAIFNVPICRTNNLRRTVQSLNESGLLTVACTEKGSENFKTVKFDQPVALIMGSEEDGISHDILAISNNKVFIPMMGKTGSLNVSVACGILLFEIAHSIRS